MASARTFGFTKSDGQVTFDREPAAIFQTLRNGRYTITIAREDDPRTIPQNKLMWMWFGLIAKDSGSSRQEVHDYFCQKYLDKPVTLFGNTVPGHQETKKLTKEQMSYFLEQIQAEAAREGMILPNPEDQYFEEFYQEFKDY